MRNRKLSRRELLMSSTALAAGAMVMHPFDAFAQSSAAQGALIARAKSLELDTPYVPPPGDALEHHAAGFAKIMCSAVFVTGLDPDFAAENVGYFTAPYEVRAQARQAGHRSRREGGPRNAAEWRDAHRQILGQPRLRDASGRPDVRELHAGERGKPAARSFDPAVAHGRRAVRRAAAAGNRRDQAQAGGRCGIRARRRHDRRLRGDLARTPDRRTLRRRHHGAHAARGLVHGQEPHRDVDGRSDQTGRLRHLAAGADPGMAKRRRSARKDSHRRHHAYVERAAHPRAAGSRLRSGGTLSRSSLLVYGQRQFVPLRRHAAAAMAAQHGRPLPQHRSGA